MHHRPLWFHLPFMLVGLFVAAVAGYDALAALGLDMPGLEGTPPPSLVGCAMGVVAGLLVARVALAWMRRDRERNTLVERLRSRRRRIDAVVVGVEQLGTTRSEDNELSWRITASADDPALGGRRLFVSGTVWFESCPVAPGDVLGVFVDPREPGHYLFDDLRRRVA